MENPRYWRMKKQRYSLIGEVCPHCDAKIFPPRDVCPECGGEAKTEYAFSGKGKVYSYTVMREAPATIAHWSDIGERDLQWLGLGWSWRAGCGWFLSGRCCRSGFFFLAAGSQGGCRSC